MTVSVNGQWAGGGSGSCPLLKNVKYINFEEAGIRWVSHIFLDEMTQTDQWVNWIVGKSFTWWLDSEKSVSHFQSVEPS